MRKIIFSISLLMLSIVTFSQAPQGLNYQAVAYDGSGVPVANQLISVRFSILDGSATGTTVYVETQNPTTDNTGLFSIVIGNGAVVSGTFSSINWGNGSKWLKTEIDINGGVNFLVMGTSQFMSVPYALYANTAASAATLEYPDGFNNITPVQLNDTIPFTVPAGKNLYANYDYVNVDTLWFTNASVTNGMQMRPFVGASAGALVKSAGTGFLVDATVQWLTVDFTCVPFVVPAGKIFIIITQNNTYVNTRAVLNGKIINRNISGQILKGGDVLTVNTPCATGARYFLNGYYKLN